MAEENGATPQVRMSVLAQFVRDMSFETMVAQKGITSTEVKPDIQVSVSLDARKRSAEHQYDVISKYRVTSKNKATGDTLPAGQIVFYRSAFAIVPVLAWLAWRCWWAC